MGSVKTYAFIKAAEFPQNRFFELKQLLSSSILPEVRIIRKEFKGDIIGADYIVAEEKNLTDGQINWLKNLGFVVFDNEYDVSVWMTENNEEPL